jgi:signal transduction histidine kinase
MVEDAVLSAELEVLAAVADLRQPGAGTRRSALRHGLAEAARTMLAAAEPSDLVRRLEEDAVTRSAVRRLFDMLGGSTALEAEDPSARALAEDVELYADEDVEALVDAHRLVRVVAVARRAARDAAQGRDAARDLLGLPVRALDALGAVPLTEASGPGDGITASRPELEARLARFADTERALAALDGELDAGSIVAEIGRIADTLLGARAGLALALQEDRLAIRGLAGLDDVSIDAASDRALAARALTLGVAEQTVVGTGDVVVDRQIARRLEADEVLALPMFAPEPVGVLILPAAVDPFGARALAALAAPRLWLPLGVGRRLDAAGRDVHSRYEQRLREVVHEANNPLSVIHNYLHILGARLDDENASREQLRLIGDEIRRTSEILQARVEIPTAPGAQGATTSEGVRVSLGALVRDVVGLLEPALMDAAGIELALDLDPADARPALDGARLRQVLLNLLKNSVEAMPEGGRILVATRTALVTASGPGFEITITDSGPGIPPELLPELFSVGTSTKGSGRGLGLGIVRRLVEELGGSISAQSRPGSGTTFRLVFPLR